MCNVSTFSEPQVVQRVSLDGPFNDKTLIILIPQHEIYRDIKANTVAVV